MAAVQLGRVKVGSAGPYWDPRDTGPDQAYAPWLRPGSGVPAPAPGLTRKPGESGAEASDWWAGPSGVAPPSRQTALPAAPVVPPPTSPPPPPTGAFTPAGTYVPPSPSATTAPVDQGTNVFDDPATQAFERLLNARVQGLNTPFQNPDFEPAVTQLRSYLARLQGPAYTPAQTDLIKTQTLDPLERQRQAARQQVVQRLAARGITPSSGIVERALEDVDQQFNQLRTQTEAGFARGAIGLERENAERAAQLAPFITQFQRQPFESEEQRRNTALSIAKIIPTLAWDRLEGAQRGIQGLDPAALLQMTQNLSNQGNAQDAAFMQALWPILWKIFRVG